MQNVTETPEEIKARVADGCQRRAEACRQKGDIYRAILFEGQAMVLNGEADRHPMLTRDGFDVERHTAIYDIQFGITRRLWEYLEENPQEAQGIHDELRMMWGGNSMPRRVFYRDVAEQVRERYL